ncbi:MAG: hypothetical protein S4CHLAM37_09900 [Chlamydiia bacterium]|nr:hypothetical protein [Chlamydiia bacterium]
MHEYATRNRGYQPVLDNYQKAYEAVENGDSWYSSGLKWHLLESKGDMNSMTAVSSKVILVVAAIALVGAGILYAQADYNQNAYNVMNAAAQLKNHKAVTPEGESTGSTFGALILSILKSQKGSN